MATGPDLQSLKVDYKRNPMLPWPFQIRLVKNETEDTFTIELQPLGGLEEFIFKPGQFNMVYVFGVGEIPISISGDPANPWHRTYMCNAKELGVMSATSSRSSGLNP